MITDRIEFRLIILLVLPFLVQNCNSNNNKTNNETVVLDNFKNTLSLNVDFSDSSNISKGFDVIHWDEYNLEEEALYYLLDIIYKDSLSCKIQIPLVATKIPFLFKFRRIDSDRIYINAIQQFNTVWGDSLVLEKQHDQYIIKEAFRLCYRGNSDAFPLKIINKGSLIILE